MKKEEQTTCFLNSYCWMHDPTKMISMKLHQFLLLSARMDLVKRAFKIVAEGSLGRQDSIP